MACASNPFWSSVRAAPSSVRPCPRSACASGELKRMLIEDVAHPLMFLPRAVETIKHDEEVDVRFGVRVSSRPRSIQHDLTQPLAVEESQVASHTSREPLHLEGLGARR